MKKSITAYTIIALISSYSGLVNSQVTANNISVEQAKSQHKQTLNTEKQLASEIFADYFAASIKLSPIFGTFIGMSEYNDKFSKPISAESLAEELALEQHFLDRIKGINRAKLNGQDLLSYDIFLRDREMAIKGFNFDRHLVPLNQMHGIHNTFASLGSGESAQPFNSMVDYQNFIKRTHGYVLYMDSVIVAMREGMEKGVVLPKVLIEKTLPQFSTHIVKDATESVYYGPVKMLATNDAISTEDKATISKQYTDLILNTLVPSYQKMHDFMTNEYLVKGRSSVGLSELPNGEAWYQYQLEVNTTLDLTAKKIHEYGQREVERILAEMITVKKQVGFKGDLPAFFEFLKHDEQFYWQDEQQVIQAYTDVRDDINTRLPALFEIFPKANYEVKAVEAFRAASSAGASYQSPAPDGSRPGIFYINTHNLKAQPKFILETLSIHEASPGHHFQTSIQQEVEGLPMFRKFGGYTVYSEGWALYAESLGKELGMFSDPYQWYGRLVDEQLRALRLVVDTGLHAFGWSREQAIKFMVDNSSMAKSDIEAEVERYIAIPGQAVSYKVGQHAIRSMRNHAQRKLGDDFDIRKFHTQILIDGALPMPILKKKIEKWVESQKSSYMQ